MDLTLKTQYLNETSEQTLTNCFKFDTYKEIEKYNSSFGGTPVSII